MTIEKKKNGRNTELILNGWMDTLNAPLLGEALESLESDTEHLTLDMTDIEYCSSAGIRQIVAAYKRMKGALTLRNVNENIMTLLNMTGLGTRLHIEP
jgi:anti-anti-sigma factor